MSGQAETKALDPRRRYSIGEVVGEKYLLEQMLGEGGMGTVWVARNMRLGSKVALKFIRPEVRVADADERLLDEARAQALLEHAAIAKVFDFGCTSEGAPFIVMELLEGRSLAEVLAERRQIACTVACQILLPVIDALVYAHESGVVHRDLKPENIFLSHDGKRTHPKLVDFGVAKLEKRLAGSRSTTEEGTVFGSPAYMAPEQARGCADADYRVDIWAICVVMFEAVTGEFAFQGNDYPALLRAVVEDDIAPSPELVAAFPGLFRIIRRGLEKDRELRWQSMRDLGQALAAWLLDQHVTT
ncbi:MAG TPA: serine/threonine-protein kinase, partial [Polyangiaceae bacterium]|nr:serine/threonine-protein kinase [Polyangiaceae bacterium]